MCSFTTKTVSLAKAIPQVFQCFNCIAALYRTALDHCVSRILDCNRTALIKNCHSS